eukprot:6304220-Amphidinium_carterae.1
MSGHNAVGRDRSKQMRLLQDFKTGRWHISLSIRVALYAQSSESIQLIKNGCQSKRWKITRAPSYAQRSSRNCSNPGQLLSLESSAGALSRDVLSTLRCRRDCPSALVASVWRGHLTLPSEVGQRQ